MEKCETIKAVVYTFNSQSSSDQFSSRNGDVINHYTNYKQCIHVIYALLKFWSALKLVAEKFSLHKFGLLQF